MGQLGFMDESNRLDKLSKLGDCLVKLNKLIDWLIFLPPIEAVFQKESKGPGGRKPYDYLMMFKILILQRIFNLSDEQTEFQINDRMSFMRFLGLGIEDTVPDAKTIWLFRDTITRAGIIRDLFDLFHKQLKDKGLITKAGTIVDATIVEAPSQRNSREEHETIKKGEIPEEWKDNPAKMQQKDTDARWTKKHGKTYFGYKNHVKADAESKLIDDYRVTNASQGDGEQLPKMIDLEEDKVIYADSAYDGGPVAKALNQKIENKICKQGRRGHLLTEEEKLKNQEYSRTRCRIEHIFAFMTESMNGITLRSIGMKRAEFNIGLTNLIYNFFRYAFLEQRKSAVG